MSAYSGDGGYYDPSNRVELPTLGDVAKEVAHDVIQAAEWIHDLPGKALEAADKALGY
jgi:hypothetical protein